MKTTKPVILPVMLSVLVLSMLISPTYPTMMTAYAAPPENKLTLENKCTEDTEDTKSVSPDCELLIKLQEETAERIAEDNLIKERLTALEEKSAELETRVTDLETRATDVETRATDLETRATDLESRATDLETRVTDLENAVEEGFDELILWLIGAEIIFTAGAVACTANAVPACATAFGALAVLTAATILVLEVIDFN